MKQPKNSKICYGCKNFLQYQKEKLKISHLVIVETINQKQDLRYCHNFLLVNEVEKPINSFYFAQSVTQRKNFKCASYVSPNKLAMFLRKFFLRNIAHKDNNDGTFVNTPIELK